MSVTPCTECRINTLYALRCFIFFFNDTATTEIYTLSLHDALPILHECTHTHTHTQGYTCTDITRSEEHTSELQSHLNLVCRLLLENKKQHNKTQPPHTPQTHTRRHVHTLHPH